MTKAEYQAAYYRQHRERKLAQMRELRRRRRGLTRFDSETKAINDLMRSWRRV